MEKSLYWKNILSPRAEREDRINVKRGPDQAPNMAWLSFPRRRLFGAEKTIDRRGVRHRLNLQHTNQLENSYLDDWEGRKGKFEGGCPRSSSFCVKTEMKPRYETLSDWDTRKKPKKRQPMGL